MAEQTIQSAGIPEPVLSISDLSAFVKQVFSQVDSYNWAIERLTAGRIEVSIITGADHIRPGGTVSGPTMFTLADMTAYFLILGHIGKVELAVTTHLSINFLNKPEPGRLNAHGRLIKLGKRLAVCEVHLYGADASRMIAQATATYSIPPH